jgi:ABC-type transport system substrate-binding protein
MDKDGLLRAWGGSTQGDVATHVVPDTMLNGALDDYNPYPSTDNAGDLEAAKAEMKLSKYDSDGDGQCDDASCKDVLHISRNSSPWTEMDPIIEASLGKIGITLQTRELADAYPVVQDVSREVPISTVAGWGKDYPDPYTFLGFLFDGRGILCTGNSNYSLVGLTKDQAGECNTSYPADGVPSVNDDIDNCVSILDTDARLDCWTELDKKLMEEIVPWIPYLDAKNTFVVSDAVTQYVYDQFSGDLGYAHVAVKP